jgi:hypothetical protein
MTARDIAWNSCDANARHISEDGKERVVICGLGCHCAPGDVGVQHYDPDLGIVWVYADDWDDE